MCPTCETALDQSNAPIAERMKAFIRERIAAGDTKSEIKARLVAEFGERVLAAPPQGGLQPARLGAAPRRRCVGARCVLGVRGLALDGRRAGRGPRADPPATGAPLDPELERRLDEELARFEA